MARKTGLQRQLEDALQRCRDLSNENFDLRTQVANLKLVSPQGDRLSSLLQKPPDDEYPWRSISAKKIADAVNHPSHYTLGGVEVIDAIEAWRLGFCLGNTVKYIARAGKKDPTKIVEDLRKARFYLDREIARLGNAK